MKISLNTFYRFRTTHISKRLKACLIFITACAAPVLIGSVLIGSLFPQAGCVSQIEVTDCGGGYFCPKNYQCVSNPEGEGFICAQVDCGNGILEPGEECDDGGDNANLPDRCRRNCTLPRCGDGIVDTHREGRYADPEKEPEECDDGELNAWEPDRCRPTCKLPRCGDGIVDSGEECDNGNDNVNDECPSGPNGTCRPAFCGDGFVREIGGPGELEQCDCGMDPNNLPPGCTHINSDTVPGACRTNCRYAGCGDGFVDEGEECDEGDMNSDTEPDACRTTCRWAYCGDGVVDSDEECDEGIGNSNRPDATCRLDCTLPRCGDGIVDSGEECDCGTDPDNLPPGCTHINSDTVPNACRTDCTLPRCGDGVIDKGEECDDGGVDTPDCNANCTVAKCGDGYVNQEAGQLCDDGNHMLNDDCPDGPDGTCIPAFCGDGFVHAINEECDTGGVDTFECNGQTCMWSRCGDGYLNVKSGEECEGSDLGGQTCVSIGMGFDSGTLSCHTDICSFDTSGCGICGDGIINGNEQCDGSNLGGASCSSLGYSGGTLQCTSSCTFNTNNCFNI